jgi:hypothetical protein
MENAKFEGIMAIIPSDNDYESYSASRKECYKFSDVNNVS